MAEQDFQEKQQENLKMTRNLVLGAIGMFAFALFVLPPMYDVFCEITGLNGKTNAEAETEVANLEANMERTVTVQFIADTDNAMPWDFKPKTRSIKVHPGEIKRVDFYVNNRTADTLVGQAIPSVSPSYGAQYLKKTECFCFNQQELAGGDDMDMPLIFFIDPEIPDHISTLTLAYKLFNITERIKGQEQDEQKAGEEELASL